MTDQPTRGDLQLIKSSYSADNTECVGVSFEITNAVAVGDTKSPPDAPVLIFDRTVWHRFIAVAPAIRADPLHPVDHSTTQVG
jgi:hypothetical protein